MKSRRLLMVSHCLPQRGPGARGRAWQLLAAAAQSHEVYLVAQADAPITLAEWRAAEGKCARMVLATSRSAGALRATAGAWAGHKPFDALVCTHPRLFQQTMSIPTAQRICDAAGASPHGVVSLIARQRDAWLARRAAAAGSVVLDRQGIDNFLDTLALPRDTPAPAPEPARLRQAA